MMLINQCLDMPHLSGGWIVLANVQVITEKDFNR